MKNDHFDLAVIGSGPGGYVAAIRAAQQKLKVAIIEKDKIGGVCLNWGCIPTKALLRSAELYQLMRHSADAGIKCEHVEIDFHAIIERSRKVATRLSKGVEYLLKKNNIAAIKGTGKIISSKQMQIFDEEHNEIDTISADHIIIATGARARTLPDITIDESKIISSKKAMNLEKQPASLVVIGAGAIGVEFAYFYNSLGTKVDIVEMKSTILPQEDEEISHLLANQLAKQKIKIHTDSTVKSVEIMDNAISVQVAKGDQTIELNAEKALIAIGVQANWEDVGAAEIGCEMERGWIKTNPYYQTNIDNVYAIGDVIGSPWLAHVASMEGIIAVEHILDKASPIEPIDYSSIPACTYCKPQIASIGLTEKIAIEMGYDIKVGRFPFQANGKALASGEYQGIVKLIIDNSNRKLLGAHIIHAEATELISELSLFKTNGLDIMRLIHAMHPHPTLSEAIAEAAADAFNRAIHM